MLKNFKKFQKILKNVIFGNCYDFCSIPASRTKNSKNKKTKNKKQKVHSELYGLGAEVHKVCLSNDIGIIYTFKISRVLWKHGKLHWYHLKPKILISHSIFRQEKQILGLALGEIKEITQFIIEYVAVPARNAGNISCFKGYFLYP